MYSWYYHRQRPSEGHLGREKRRAFSPDLTDCPLFSGTSSITDVLGKSKSSPSSSSGFVVTLDGGTPPWIDPTGVCRAWLIFTIRVQTVW